jgi:histidyl-tRNA synthetase
MGFFIRFTPPSSGRSNQMANFIQAPRGTMDILPEKATKWQHIEAVIRDTARLCGFSELRFPTFEYTELFSRGVGETTDVVQKEMYTFEDRGGRSITLRPEGTASTVRTVLQNGLHNGPMPLKLYYLISCFRGERPQAGRLREFHQFGAELFGTACAAADVDLISLASLTVASLGLEKLRLEINSIGCPDCRKLYHAALREYFTAKKDELCETCLGRLEHNPMRILDCKNESCKNAAQGAPVVLDYICGDCRAHFDEVKAGLDAQGIKYVINPTIVRGLDYYTRTVFEFIDENAGLTVCGGGRYDGLVSELGGPALPALGFGMGLERLLMVMEQQSCPMPDRAGAGVFFAPIGEAATFKAAELTRLLRAEGFAAEYELAARSLKAQMKYADKRSFDYTVVIGDDELKAESAVLRNMRTGDKKEITLGDGFIKAFYASSLDETFAGVEMALNQSLLSGKDRGES